MRNESDPALGRSLVRLSRFCSLLALCFGFVVLTGWTFHIYYLKTFLPGQVTVKANTAVCMILLGIASWLASDPGQRPRSTRTILVPALAFLVSIVGLISLLETIYGWDPGLDEMIFTAHPEDGVGSVRPTLMSPIAALDFCLLGLAVTLSVVPGRWSCRALQGFSLVSGMASIFGILDFILNLSTQYTHIAVSTALVFLFLSTGTLLLRTDDGMGALLASTSFGGEVARRLLPATVFIPLLVGWLRWKGESAGLYSGWIGVVLMTIAAIILIGGLTVWTAFVIDRTDRARKHALQSLQHMASIVTCSNDGIIGKTLDGIVTSWNPGAEVIYGYSAKEMIGRSIKALIPPTHVAEFESMMQRVASGEQIRHYETPRIRKDGKIIDISLSFSPVRDQTGKIVGCSTILRDTTEEKQSQKELESVNRILRALSECTESLMRAEDEDGMLRDVCSAVVKVGQFRMAWVGYAEQDEQKSVRPMAWAGAEEGYLKSANISWADVQRGRGPTGTAIRTGKSVVCNDTLRDPHFLPWRQEAERRGYGSSIVLPLQAESGIFGALMIYAGEAQAFQAREQRLLEEFAANLSYAINALRARTELRKSEEQLRKAARYTRSLIEASVDPLVTISREGKITDVNRATESATGVEREQLIGSDFSNYFTEPDQARRGYRQVFAEGFVHDYPLALRHTSGRITDVLYNASLFKNEKGEVEGVFAAARDVTARKQAEEKARRASLYTRSLIEASVDPLVTISREGKITDVNRATESATGISREQLIGSDFSNYFTEPDEARRGYQQVFAEGLVHDYSLALRHTCGRITDVLYNASLFKNEKGEVEGVFAAARDVTARKRAEAALISSETRYRSLVIATAQIVWSTNAAGEVVEDLPTFQSFAGRTQAELQGWGWVDTLHPDDRQRAAQIWSKAVANHSLYEIEYRMRRADGEYRYMSARGVPVIDKEGSVREWIGFCNDITERKLAEDEVRKLNDELEERVKQRTAQLEAANKELEAFTYSVSHDLRAPLRHISGFSKILSEEFGPSLPEEARHHLERIQQGTSRMGTLVDDLLNLARVGRQEIRLQVTGLNSLVDEIIVLLKPDCEGRQVEWNVGSLPFIECDPGLMKQVLNNLLSNALKFTRPRPVAVIEVGQVEQQGGSVIFVRDNGVGFSMKYADKLFGVFQRLHRPEDFEGTGVGLATVQRILHKHGGNIWAESELDKGTTFYFTLAGARSEQPRTMATMVGGNS